MTTVYGNFKTYEEAFKANPLPADGQWYRCCYQWNGPQGHGVASVELSPRSEKSTRRKFKGLTPRPE